MTYLLLYKIKRINLVLLVLLYFTLPSIAQKLSYHFDNLNRLAKINYRNSASFRYSYDGVGNRLNCTILTKIQSAVLSVSPLKDTINANAGSIASIIQNKGKGTMNWTAVSNSDWLSFAGDTSGINSDTIVIDYSSNTGPPRDGTVTIISTQATNSPQIISIHQAGYINHLWHIAKTGSDINGDGSESKPFATIQKGIDTAASRDTILVSPGTYYENLNINAKDLKIVSMWEFSADSSDITNTIIDGNKRGRVFTLYNVTSSTHFNGFTITDGLDTIQNGSGGAINLTNSNPELSNLIIKNNMAQYGGAISCYQSNPSLYNIKIFNNTATHEGGGISCNQSDPVIKNSVINFNISSGNGGGLSLYDSSNARMVNTLITNNKASLGGGAISTYKNCLPEFINITVAGNKASQSPGIQSSKSTPTISNSIIWNKSYFDNATITYSDIKGSWAGTGNIDSYPEFQDTTMYNYSLKCISPCLNSGSPDTTGLETGSNDILGNLRIFDNVIDMGAFEYQGTPIPGKAGIITGDTSVCQGSTSVIYSVAAISNATSYIWTLPKGITGKSSDNSILVNFDSTATSGNIKVMGNNICGTGTEGVLFVKVNRTPKSPVITLNNGVLYSDSPYGNQWYFNNMILQNAINDTLIPTKKGDYYVIVTINTCSSQPSNVISFIPLSTHEISTSDKIRIYPNPTTGFVEVTFAEPLGNYVKIEIIDSFGKVMRTILKSRVDNKFSLNLSNYPAGIYLIKFSDSQKFYFSKIIKQ